MICESVAELSSSFTKAMSALAHPVNINQTATISQPPSVNSNDSENCDLLKKLMEMQIKQHSVMMELQASIEDMKRRNG